MFWITALLGSVLIGFVCVASAEAETFLRIGHSNRSCAQNFRQADETKEKPMILLISPYTVPRPKI